MLEMKCKLCGETFKAKDSTAMVNAAKAHFKKDHSFMPVTDEMIKDAVKKDAKKVK